LLASERAKSGAESDARTILGYLLLRELLSAGAKAPPEPPGVVLVWNPPST